MFARMKESVGIMNTFHMFSQIASVTRDFTTKFTNVSSRSSFWILFNTRIEVSCSSLWEKNKLRSFILHIRTFLLIFKSTFVGMHIQRISGVEAFSTMFALVYKSIWIVNILDMFPQVTPVIRDFATQFTDVSSRSSLWILLNTRIEVSCSILWENSRVRFEFTTNLRSITNCLSKIKVFYKF